ncbi:MAG: extracellular solute-binding protein [Clostridia bacterium]|nr:extracellular solute-binding protein [Clostridia bacterium]
MKKFLAVLSSLLCVTLVGCNSGQRPTPDSGDDGTDPTRAKKLIVGVYDGAVGYEFAESIAELYEAYNKDVDVVIKHKKNEYDDGSLISKIAYNEEDMYFGSGNNLLSFVHNGLVAELTDAVREKVYDAEGNYDPINGTKSIEDIMWDEWEAFNMIDGKYYGIPNFSPAGGISYDEDLFEAKGYQVPETYDELITLMNQMVVDKITPFTVCSVQDYIISTAVAFYANYEGKNNFLLNSTYSGTDSNLGKIDYTNAYLLQQQEGRKAYFQFLYDLAHNDDYTTSASKGSQTNLNAQDAFVSSIGGSERIGMIIENSFWEREAKGTIEQLGDLNANWGWGKRNFKYMIAPVNKQTDKKTVFLTYPTSSVFISANSDQIELAKEFMQFSCSRECLAIYTRDSGCLRAFDYEVKAEEYAQMTPYTQSLVDLTRRDDVDFVTMGQGNMIARNIGVAYYRDWTNQSLTTKYGLKTMPFSAFRAYSDLTVEDYFAGCARHMSADTYKTYYDKVYGD